MSFNKLTDKILLINIPPIIPSYHFNHGLTYLKAYLDKNEINNDILDINREYDQEENINHIYTQHDKYRDFVLNDEDIKIKIKKIVKDNLETILEYNILGFSIFDYQSSVIFEVLYNELIKELPENIKIIIGGNHLIHFDTYKQYEKYSKYVCNTDGEVFFQKLYNLEKTEPFDYNQYNDSDLIYHDKPVMILYSRGCIHNCDFCVHKYINRNNIFYRNKMAIINEIFYYKKTLNVNEFNISTENIANNIDNLNDFTKTLSLLNVNKDIFWNTNFSPVKFELHNKIDFAQLRRAGCAILSIGVESFSENVRRKMNKSRYTNDDIRKYFLTFRENKIKVRINIIIGYFSETEEEFNENMIIMKQFYEEFRDIIYDITYNVYSIYYDEHYLNYKNQIKFDDNGNWYLDYNNLKYRKKKFKEMKNYINTLNLNNKYDEHFNSKEIEIY